MTNAPDEYSNARIWQLFRGYEHQLTRMNSDWVDLWEKLHSLEDQVNSLLESREKDKAEIGKLQESIERAREAFTAMKRERASDEND